RDRSSPDLWAGRPPSPAVIKAALLWTTLRGQVIGGRLLFANPFLLRSHRAFFFGRQELLSNCHATGAVLVYKPQVGGNRGEMRRRGRAMPRCLKRKSPCRFSGRSQMVIWLWPGVRPLGANCIPSSRSYCRPLRLWSTSDSTPPLLV